MVVSLGLYLVLISDWVLAYELLVGLFLIITAFASILLLVFFLVESIKYRQLPSNSSVFIFILILITYAVIYGYRNGFFWGEKIVTAVFIDDRNRVELELFKNGKFLIYSNWFFGEERFEGIYKLHGDTVVFSNDPMGGNNFISQKILMNTYEKKIYFQRKNDGSYDKSFYYFQMN